MTLDSRNRSNRWLHTYAVLVTAATFVLIVAGALVTSNDAGLSVPDWPTSFGSFRTPPMEGGVLYEHGHRMIAGTVGILTIILAIWMWLKESRRWLRRLGVAAVLAVILQAVLGGVTVLFHLPAAVSVGHAALAQLFFCLMVGVALFTREDWSWAESRAEDSSRPSIRALAVLTTVGIFAQLILGAGFRHAGLGITPHVVGAIAVTAMIMGLASRVLAGDVREARLRRSAQTLLWLLVVQLFLGLAAYAVKFKLVDHLPGLLAYQAAITAAHVAVGALVLATSVVLTLNAYRFLSLKQENLAAGQATEQASL